MLRDEPAPKEGHQLQAASLGRCGPIAPVGVLILELLIRPQGGSQHAGVEAAEDLLDAGAVERDENDRITPTVGRRGSLAAAHRGCGESDRQQQYDE
jgi:hypothetical protein